VKDFRIDVDVKFAVMTNMDARNPIWWKILINPRATILELDGWDRWRYWVITVLTGIMIGIYTAQVSANDGSGSSFALLVFGPLFLIVYNLVFGVLVGVVQRISGMRLSFYQIQLSIGWSHLSLLILFAVLVILRLLLKSLVDPMTSFAALVGTWYFFQTYSSLGKKTYGSAWLVVQAAGLLFVILAGIVYGIFQAVNQ
jgi:hypothetical protein